MVKRKRKERQQIIAALVAENSNQPLSSFNLSEREEKFYRARALKAIERATKRTAHFRNAYPLPVAKPFGNVIIASLAVILATWSAAGLYLWLYNPDDKTPVFTGCLVTMVAAVGWAVAGFLTHRNTIRQSTNNILFARFSQAQFGENLESFHRAFGFDETVGITPEQREALRATGKDKDWKTATSIGYLLNYFELLASGVIKGDLDKGIVQENFRGVICFYHDKCWPIIDAARREDHRTYANLIRLKTYFDSIDELRSLRRRNINLLVIALGVIGLAVLRLL